MTHHLIQSDEAEWTGMSRVWTGIQQFSPRRGKLSGHVVAALVGLALAALVIAIQQGVRA